MSPSRFLLPSPPDRCCRARSICTHVRRARKLLFISVIVPFRHQRTLCGVLRRNASIALNGLDDSQQPRRGSSSEPAGSIIIINGNRPFIPTRSFLTEIYRRKRDAIGHSSKVLFQDKCTGWTTPTIDTYTCFSEYNRRRHWPVRTSFGRLRFANFARFPEDSKITRRRSGARVTRKIRNPKSEAYTKHRP